MDSIKKLQDIFAKFPSVGPRTAGRFVFYLLKLPKERVNELVLAITELQKQVKLCSFCFNPYEGEGALCSICGNAGRNKQLLCVVEKETDLNSIETTKRYQGLYFILGGTVSLLKPNGASLRIDELKSRILHPDKHGLAATNFSEIILALNPTQEGKATAVLVERSIKELSTLKPSTFKLTHLAQGLPVGGELEYADEETLESAFEGRK